MRYYIEITFIQSDGFSFYQLWTKVYTQLHLAFVEIKDQNDNVNIGVSFPEYRFDNEKCIGFLGTKLRLFAKTAEELQQLNLDEYLIRLVDYIHISTIRPVPYDRVSSYAKFCRKQFKTNAERLARHRVKTRNDISFDDAVKFYQNRIKSTDLPFIQMKSLTNSQMFKLFIEKIAGEQSDEHKFNTYGLSLGSTVPEF